ncbi:hypothetical protein F7725_010883 [Dissostichus mawsoni]|uniref:Uncharacterized protein n=1 Tax=Dissostichus mawsoni TaxID=36200 RepID=A0A7J5Z791_DISMA|nr:hypothetical protein F7725_010883 [Dissostichus mawsoni]
MVGVALNFTVFNLARSFFSTLRTDRKSWILASNLLYSEEEEEEEEEERRRRRKSGDDGHRLPGVLQGGSRLLMGRISEIHPVHLETHRP